MTGFFCNIVGRTTVIVSRAHKLNFESPRIDFRGPQPMRTSSVVVVRDPQIHFRDPTI